MVATYCIGMTLFTMIKGNAFAAFQVITLEIGLPPLITLHGGNPAIVAAALLDLPDNSVIKAQWPTALMLLVINIFLMYIMLFYI